VWANPPSPWERELISASLPDDPYPPLIGVDSILETSHQRQRIERYTGPLPGGGFHTEGRNLRKFPRSICAEASYTVSTTIASEPFDRELLPGTRDASDPGTTSK
jgi:hypothetical protein